MEIERRSISSKELFMAISEQLAEQRRAVFIVTGMSMWPLLCHGRDSVIIEATDETKIRKGDIVLIRVNEERYILHRVTKLLKTGFETTGDGNYFRDGVFPYDCLFAKVVQLVRRGKTIDCNTWYIKLYGLVWRILFPFRKIIFAIWFRLRPFLRRNKDK